MRDALSYVASMPGCSALCQRHRATGNAPDTIRNQLIEQVIGMVRWRESVANMAAAGVDDSSSSAARCSVRWSSASPPTQRRRHRDDRRHRSAGEEIA